MEKEARILLEIMRPEKVELIHHICNDGREIAWLKEHSIVYVPRRERVHPVVVRPLRVHVVPEAAEVVASLVVGRRAESLNCGKGARWYRNVAALIIAMPIQERVANGEAIEWVMGIPRGVEERRSATLQAFVKIRRPVLNRRLICGNGGLDCLAECTLKDAELDLARCRTAVG